MAYKSLEIRRAAIKQVRDKRRAWAIARLGGACIHCGETDPAQLHFHHIDRASKLFEIGRVIAEVSAVRLKEEVDKCSLWCYTCHMELSRNLGHHRPLAGATPEAGIDDDEWEELMGRVPK